MKTLTAKQIQRKYKDKYVDVSTLPIWEASANGERLYEVRRVYSKIHENTTRGEDVGTGLEFAR